jgi:hypothetical protein
MLQSRQVFLHTKTWCLPTYSAALDSSAHNVPSFSTNVSFLHLTVPSRNQQRKNVCSSSDIFQLSRQWQCYISIAPSPENSSVPTYVTIVLNCAFCSFISTGRQSSSGNVSAAAAADTKVVRSRRLSQSLPRSACATIAEDRWVFVMRHDENDTQIYGACLQSPTMPVSY